jgi:hypothetical protein
VAVDQPVLVLLRIADRIPFLEALLQREVVGAAHTAEVQVQPVVLGAAARMVEPAVLVIPQARHHHKVIMAEQVLTIVLLAEVAQVLLDQIQLPIPDQTVVLVRPQVLLALQ